MEDTQAKIMHVFKEAHQLVDKLANQALYQGGSTQCHKFQDLPIKCRKIFNIDKEQIFTLNIKVRRINIQGD